MRPLIEVVIQKGTAINRARLLDLKRDKRLAANVSVVYIYSLVEETVNYPNEMGHVVYIGEAGRPSEPTGTRFAQHISTSETRGSDSGTIYSLSRYYWRGMKIRLKIILVENFEARKALERNLLSAHVKRFGALPICQGTTGSNYRTTLISAYNPPEDHALLLVPNLVVS